MSSLIGQLQARGITLSRLQDRYPMFDRAVRVTRRTLYLRSFFREGPRRTGTSRGRTFVILNHCYDLDVDALCSADGPHTIWVLDAFKLFIDVLYYFTPEQRDLSCVYGEGAMRDSIARYKKDFVTAFALRLRDEVHVDALITPCDTAYYMRPLIEELDALGIPTIVQDKEGTIAPSPIMDDHARVLAERYPPIGDQYLFWNATVRDFWRKVGLAEDRMRVIGQPRSDFFFHSDRWPSKTALGLAEDKKLIVVFTYDSDVYLRVTEPLPDRPWKSMRDDLHEVVRSIARDRSDVEIVFKAHPQQAELAEISAELASHALPNVRLITGASSASHLIVRADVILGFQSTVMIEAMFTPKPVIYAGWGAHHDKMSHTLIPIHSSGGCVMVKDRADLERRIREALDGHHQPSPEMMRARKAFTDRYFFDADGLAASRVLDAAAEVVTRRESAV